MTEQIFRQPLSVLPIARPAQNIKNNSPTLNGKRTYDSAGFGTKGANPVGTVTPTKALTTTATNGRRSVKRVKPDVTVREDTELSIAEMRAKAEEEHAAKLKTWIASYKKQFPSLRFFFDACSEDDVRRCTRKIMALGGSVEPFFSNNVNVVVTTRELPKVQETSGHLQRTTETQSYQSGQSISACTLIPHATRTTPFPPQFGTRTLEPLTRPEYQIQDVLVKAQSLNIKIWTMKKLRDSVLKNLVTDHVQPSNLRTLSNSLRTEKYVGAGEENIGQFKGPYILIRDMEEQYRPVMCREWPNVSNSKDGEWPQWRTTRSGRCPFIRDKHAEQHKEIHVTKVRPERPMIRAPFQHANASGIQQITSAIQSNIGRSGWSGKENMGSGVANLHKKAVTAKRTPKLNTNGDPTDIKKVKVDVKAGYCENCREKFEDFDAHLRTRSHRNYAKTEANFNELDTLLADLMRPPRTNHPVSI